MRFPQRPAAIAMLVIACGMSVPAHAGQTAAAPATVVLTPEQMEAFLLNAKIVRMRSAGDGVTNSRRATLSDGSLTHDAHVQIIDQSRLLFEAGRATELNFKDTYRYNIAAYRLARLLEIDNVPMSVERQVEGRSAAVTWWVDDVMMDESDRLKKKLTDPNGLRGAGYAQRYRVFDQLIQNRDRNRGNLLYTSNWKLWMIDHTRAFRLNRELQNPDQVVRIERALFESLKRLTPASVEVAVGTSLIKGEIAALLARRDAIVTLVEGRIARRGEAAVLYTIPE